MMNNPLLHILTSYTQTHLICNSAYPLICNSSLEEEAILYNLKPYQINQVIADFLMICNKQITITHNISTLSGGQKIILMTILAMLSPAQKILFVNLYVNLDIQNKEALQIYISNNRSNKTEIVML